jgi:hypothetical protein
MLGKMLEQSCFPTHPPCPEEWVPDRQSSVYLGADHISLFLNIFLYEMQINNMPNDDVENKVFYTFIKCAQKMTTHEMSMKIKSK